MQVDDVLKEPLAQPWIPTDEEASMMRDMVAKDKSWQKNLEAKEQWLFGVSGDTGEPPWSAHSRLGRSRPPPTSLPLLSS